MSRWKALFDDLEAQADALDAAELAGEVRDRSRREAALLRTVDRLVPSLSGDVTVHLQGAGPLPATLADIGPDWLLLDEGGGREVLVPLGAVLGVTGLRPGARAPGAEGEVARRLDLRWALRGLARDRAALGVQLRDGSGLSGTLDRVGADHVELAEHPPGEPRRPGAVRGVRLVPLEALVLLRRA